MSTDNDLMLEILKELREDMKDVKVDINEIKLGDIIQNQQLSDHMKRTELAEQRIEKLEKLHIKEPINWRAVITWTVGIASTISATAYTISKMI